MPIQKPLNQLLGFTNSTKHIFDYAHPKIFDQLLIYVNLYQKFKNQAISLVCSSDMIDKRILESDRLRIFWARSLEQKFSQI